MAYTPDDLHKKLLAMYPEISKEDLSMTITFDNQRKAWVLTFEKGGHVRHAFLDEKDADDCMEGNKCIYLGMIIPQYIRALKEDMAGGT